MHLCVIIITVVCARYADAASKELQDVIQSKLLSSGLECVDEGYPIYVSDLRAFKDKRMPNKESSKCFAACLFKKVGILDNMGKVNPSTAREIAKQVLRDSEEHRRRVTQLVRVCSKVNKQMTSDGNRGCERAKLAFECLTQNADRFGFDFEISNVGPEDYL